jgi:hypothetical protein
MASGSFCCPDGLFRLRHGISQIIGHRLEIMTGPSMHQKVRSSTYQRLWALVGEKRCWTALPFSGWDVAGELRYMKDGIV